jgi:hypothetical protein
MKREGLPWRLATALACCLCGTALGLAFGLLFWRLYLLEEGAAVEDALKGHVEDAISSLWGLLVLGAVVGSCVGACWGFSKASTAKRPPGTMPP